MTLEQTVVNDYGDCLAEHQALRSSVGILDLSFRGRVCLTGADRMRFLHGQVTNDIKRLAVGSGCYTALTTAKGKMESDLNVYCLADELLLDFQPGLTSKVSQRLEKFIVADDVQIVDVSPLYALLSLQGPKAKELLQLFGNNVPSRPFDSIKLANPEWGETYFINQPRTGSLGFDIFVPADRKEAATSRLLHAGASLDGRMCGWLALERARIEAGVPRFGQDMDETNIPIECGIEARAISYTKGCYIGQEVLNRIHTLGHVNKELRGLRLPDELAELPSKGEPLVHDGKAVGYITSATASAGLFGNIALGYVRREVNAIGTELLFGPEKLPATIVELPFKL
jgi:folate-binding protein YgfZ